MDSFVAKEIQSRETIELNELYYLLSRANIEKDASNLVEMRKPPLEAIPDSKSVSKIALSCLLYSSSCSFWNLSHNRKYSFSINYSKQDDSINVFESWIQFGNIRFLTYLKALSRTWVSNYYPRSINLSGNLYVHFIFQ